MLERAPGSAHQREAGSGEVAVDGPRGRRRRRAVGARLLIGKNQSQRVSHECTHDLLFAPKSPTYAKIQPSMTVAVSLPLLLRCLDSQGSERALQCRRTVCTLCGYMRKAVINVIGSQELRG